MEIILHHQNYTFPQKISTHVYDFLGKPQSTIFADPFIFNELVYAIKVQNTPKDKYIASEICRLARQFTLKNIRSEYYLDHDDRIYILDRVGSIYHKHIENACLRCRTIGRITNDLEVIYKDEIINKNAGKFYGKIITRAKSIIFPSAKFRDNNVGLFISGNGRFTGFDTPIENADAYRRPYRYHYIGKALVLMLQPQTYFTEIPSDILHIIFCISQIE